MTAHTSKAHLTKSPITHTQCTQQTCLFLFSYCSMWFCTKYQRTTMTKELRSLPNASSPKNDCTLLNTSCSISRGNSRLCGLPSIATDGPCWVDFDRSCTIGRENV